MKLHRAIPAAVVLAAIAVPVAAQDTIAVSLEITAPDAIQSSIESAITQELRSHSDIEIVTMKQYFGLHIVCAWEPAFPTVACAAIALDLLDGRLVRNACLVPKHGYLAGVLQAAESGSNGDLAHLSVTIGSTRDYKEMAARLIAMVDTSAFEPLRRTRADLRQAASR